MEVHASSSYVSVVVCALNEAPTLQRTVENLQSTLPVTSEIIVVDDGSTDGGADFLVNADSNPDAVTIRLLRTEGLGAAQARNWGATHAKGDVIIFADAHIETTRGWWEPLVCALADPKVGAVNPVISVMGNPNSRGYGYRFKDANLGIEWLGRQGENPYPVPLLSACCLAMRRETFITTGGFDRGLRRWGSEDSELSLRLWLLGYDLQLVPQSEIAHLFRQQHPYTVSWTDVIYNMLRLTMLHFNLERLTRTLEALKSYRDFAAAMALVAESNTWQRRAELMSCRTRDDNWFFQFSGVML